MNEFLDEHGAELIDFIDSITMIPPIPLPSLSPPPPLPDQPRAFAALVDMYLRSPQMTLPTAELREFDAICHALKDRVAEVEDPPLQPHQVVVARRQVVEVGWAGDGPPLGYSVQVTAGKQSSRLGGILGFTGVRRKTKGEV